MLYGDLPTVPQEGGATVRGVTIKIQNPPKTAIIGLPTNAQMVERLDSQKTIRRSLGRRASTSDYIPNTKADLALFNQIRVDKDGLEFDEFEATSAIGRITNIEVTGCERSGDFFEVTLKSPFGEVVHTVGIPLQRDLQKYRRGVVSSKDLPHGQEELRYRIEPPCTLYDTVSKKVEGYNDSFNVTNVPPHHKSAVVMELVQALDEMDTLIDPN